MEKKIKSLLKLVGELCGELDDAADFMGTFEDGPDDWMGDEGKDRLNRKRELLGRVDEELERISKIS